MKERTIKQGEDFEAAYLVPYKAERVTFKDEGEITGGRRMGPVWVDGEPYAKVTYNEYGTKVDGWYSITVARKIAKQFGCSLEEV